MSGGIRISSCVLPVIGGLEAWRLFNVAKYEIRAGGKQCPLTIDEVCKMGRKLTDMDLFLRLAARRAEPVKKTGTMFRCCDESGALRFELGIVDATSIYFQILSLPRLTLDEEYSQTGLMRALAALRQDARKLT
jgi:hypothetical protein